MDGNCPESASLNPAFLVHIDCECGWLAGVPEGSKWPDCPYCEKPVRTRDERGARNMRGYVAVRCEEKYAAFAVLTAQVDAEEGAG
jgi:hypothetical protein